MATHILKGLRTLFEMPATSKKSENKLKYWEHIKLPKSLCFKKPVNNHYSSLPLDLLLQDPQFKLHIKSKKSVLSFFLFLKVFRVLLKLLSLPAIEIKNQKLETSNVFIPLITKLKPTEDGKEHA